MQEWSLLLRLLLRSESSTITMEDSKSFNTEANVVAADSEIRASGQFVAAFYYRSIAGVELEPV